MFHVASEDEIRAGRTTDVYFARAMEILRAEGRDPEVAAEVMVHGPPGGWPWGVLAGVEEVARLVEGVEVDVESLPEGSVFYGGEPVLVVRGRYASFGVLETALLGLLCQATGVATKALRLRLCAGDRRLLSFGARRVHPAISPMVERASFLGGCDGVSVIRGAELIGEVPSGTMPHALVLILGDTTQAALAFDRTIDPSVPRVVLVDTFTDERFETLKVAEAMGGKLQGVRLDTPGSRRGDIRAILEEIRWELDLRGFGDVRLMVSGGLDEAEVVRLRDAADGFGVGTCLASAPVVDFSLDLVEVDGRPLAKRGKCSGAKALVRCRQCGRRRVVRAARAAGACECGGQREALRVPLVSKGAVVGNLPRASEIRDHVQREAGRERLSAGPGEGRGG